MNIIYTIQTICITPQEIECTVNIEMDTKHCMIPCEGIFADVTKTEAENVNGKHYEKLLRSYNKYKRFFDVSESMH